MMDPRVFLLSVLGPLIGYNLTLKTARILSHVDPGLIDFFRLIGSDLAFALAYISLWLGLFALTRRGSGARKVLLVLLPAVSALFALTTTIAHQYFSVTGVALSYQVLAFSISGLDEVRPIIASEASFTSWFVVLAYFAMGPWLLSRVLVCSPDGTNPSHEVRDYRLTYLAGLTAVGFGLLSLIPRGEGVSRPFARDPFVNLLATAVGDWRHNEPVRARPRPATNARLDRTPLTTDRNVVLIILESTGANVVNPYNPGLPTTPHLAELAEKRSLLVERVYTVVPHTSKALVPILCGIEPHLVMEITEGDVVSDWAACSAITTAMPHRSSGAPVGRNGWSAGEVCSGSPIAEPVPRRLVSASFENASRIRPCRSVRVFGQGALRSGARRSVSGTSNSPRK